MIIALLSVNRQVAKYRGYWIAAKAYARRTGATRSSAMDLHRDAYITYRRAADEIRRELMQ